MGEKFTFHGQRDDEDVLFLIKQNVWVFTKTGLVTLLLANLIVFITILFGANGFFSYLLVLFVLAIGFLIGYRWYIWTNAVYILTNKRVIKVDQQGLFHRLISEIELDRIQDITTEVKGPIQTFFNFGTIHIVTASSNKGIELNDVTDPYDIQQQIVKALNLMKNDLAGKIEIRDNFGGSF